MLYKKTLRRSFQIKVATCYNIFSSNTTLQDFAKVPLCHSHFRVSRYPSFLLLNSFLFLSTSYHKGNINHFKGPKQIIINMEMS